MKQFISLLSILCFGIVVFAQDSKDPILLKVEGQEVFLSEFEAVYNKNNSNAQAIDPKSKSEYLDLYINFKLKVAEAEALGMDTNRKFINELAGYRKQLAEPYLTDQQVTDDLIKEAYDRSKFDVNAFHILVQVDENASPKDTMAALKKIKNLFLKIKDPLMDFEKIAKTASEDPSAATNGGDLGYFSAFQMVYPFETAAFNTAPGSISDPIRTRFGYHIIYVKDKRSARGEIHAAHIMVKVENGEDVDEVDLAEKKINELYQNLNDGENFENLAKEFSDDQGSARDGGELPWFGTGRMVPAFENAAFGLEKDGEFSKPIRSRFGWHIVKRLEVRKVPEFDAIKDELKKKVTRDGRGSKSKSSFYAKVKKEYDFQLNQKNLLAMSKIIDTDYYERKWKARDKAKGMRKPIFMLEDSKYMAEKKTVNQADFAVYIEQNRKFQRIPKTDPMIIIDQLFDGYVKQVLTSFENKRLEKKYPKFGALMKEYHDGILLFDLMDQKVWSKAVKDTIGLQAYYEANKTQHVWPDRLDAVVFNCGDKKLAKKTYKMAKKMMKSMTYNEDSLLSYINVDSQLNLKIEDEKFEKGTHDYVDRLDWSAIGFTKIQSDNEKYRFAYLRSFLPTQPKQLDEAKGLYISAYQDYLEKEWLQSLKDKYKVEVFREVLQ
ncbi:MAG: peptidyl-prolyl cis-trans isomerase SurA [Salibacteraceae bacterium]|jgi:peptidyl-prolyl cis-trans isomerase SurA